MPKISVYAGYGLYEKITSKAKEKEMSLSGFVSEVLKEHVKDEWPEGYFEKFAGALKDRVFEVPEDLPWEPDE